MIPGLEPISVNSLAFALLSLSLIALAWSKYKHLFPIGFTIGSGLLIATWLSPLDLAALMLFLIPPYVAIRMMWGKPRYAASLIAAMVILWEVILFVYLRKYQWAGDTGWLDHPIAIIGLSYILFRVIHLLVEAPGLGHLPFSLHLYGSYVLAFWTLLSGPIQRYEAFYEGMGTIGRPSTDHTLAAAHRGVNGLIKAFLVAPVFLKSSDLSALGESGTDWIDFAIVFYSYPIYLYLNFSGYTDLMIAIARLCCMTTLPENFNRPYLARNVQDFWSRWHMSFGVWIRHYVFTPLSKDLLSRTSPSVHNMMLAFIVIVTFVIVGMWHGTTSNFLIFGILHGAAIIFTALYGKLLRSLLGKAGRKAFESHPVINSLSTVLCFHFVCATILLFPNSADDVANALIHFSAQLSTP